MYDVEKIHKSKIDPCPKPPLEPLLACSAERAFDIGNYPVALQNSKPDETELIALSKIMCGLTKEGLVELGTLKVLSEKAKLIREYAYSCLGKDDRFLKKFTYKTDQPVDILLFTMPNSRHTKLFENIFGFNIQSVQLRPHEFGISWEEVFARLALERMPQMILVIDCYGAYLPCNFSKIKIPKIFWVSDHDFFFSTRYFDLTAADVIIVNSASEHDELSKNYNARIASFPGYEDYNQAILKDQAGVRKNRDLLFTGRAYVPYMRDKAQQLFNLCCIDDRKLKIEVINGFLSSEQFIEKISSTKFVPLYWRYGGGFQTRAIEALTNSAKVLSPESGICQELIGMNYQLIGTTNLETNIMNSLNPKVETVKKDRKREPLELFWRSPDRENRFLKFCLFQTLFIDRSDTKNIPSYGTPVELRGYEKAAGIDVYLSIMRLNLNEACTASHFNFAGAAGFYAAILDENNQDLARLSIESYQEGVRVHPTNLALFFNYARVLWTFGHRRLASRIFSSIIYGKVEWKFDPKIDALLSHRVRVLAQMFPYGDYYRAVVESLETKQRMNLPKLMIMASAKTYLAKSLLEKENADKALVLLNESIDSCPTNFSGYQLLVETLHHGSQNLEKRQEYFYSAINIYPFLLFEMLQYGIEIEIGLGNEKKAKDILSKFILAYSRLFKPDGSFVEVPDNTKNTVMKYKYLLSGWKKEIADKLFLVG